VRPEDLKHSALLKAYKELAEQHGELQTKALACKDPALRAFAKERAINQLVQLVIAVHPDEMPQPANKPAGKLNADNEDPNPPPTAIPSEEQRNDAQAKKA